MSCFAVEFILCRSPGMTHYIDKIKAYDMGEATTLFFNIMANKFGISRDKINIKDILEMKHNGK